MLRENAGGGWHGRSRLFAREFARNYVAVLILPFYLRVFLIDPDLLLHGLPLIYLGDLDFLCDDPFPFHSKPFCHDRHDDSVADVADRLRAIYNSVGLYAFYLDATVSKFLLKNLVMTLDTLNYADTPGFHWNGVRVQFLVYNGNDLLLFWFHVVSGQYSLSFGLSFCPNHIGPRPSFCPMWYLGSAGHSRRSVRIRLH